MPFRQLAAINFKNFVRQQWDNEDSAVSAEDRQAIKSQIIDLMLVSPEALQVQLSESIAKIALCDFPENWQTLLPHLVSKFDQPDFHSINGVLRTMNPLFRRYRFAQRSDRLWSEIKYVLDLTAQPLTTLFQNTFDLVKQNEGNISTLKVLIDSIRLICEVFYSLNYQDLAAFFEDNMSTWMEGFAAVLELPENKALMADIEDTPGVLELAKAQICTNISLYASKYDEEFAPHLPRFVQIVWELLTTTSLETRYDGLVSTALSFLASVSEREANKELFANQETMQTICEKVIVPNVMFRPEDEEIFSDNPEEYIRRDIEGSDIDTRRRAASDLVRGLCKFWEEPVTSIFSVYVTQLLQEHSTDATKWKHKDAAVFLIIALAVRTKTTSQGTTALNSMINVVDVFHSTILPELQDGDANKNVVLKADAIKYLVSFRNQVGKDLDKCLQLHLYQGRKLGPEIHAGCFPLLINLLSSDEPVVVSYAAHCIELQLLLKVNDAPVLSREVLAANMEALLSNLFSALGQVKNAENEYLMKTVMRTIAMGEELVIPYIAIIVERLSLILMEVAKNPGRPRFNHFMFESFAAAIRATCHNNQDAIASFESALFPPFEQLLTGDVIEFQPYVFQLLALLLELRTKGIPQSYAGLLPFLLAPAMWESRANSTPLVRLLSAYITNGGDELFTAENKQLDGMLGVFQKLIASKVDDHNGFELLMNLIDGVSPQMLEPYFGNIVQLLMTRMQAARTTKFTRCLAVLVGFLSLKRGPSATIQLFDNIQQGLFGMLLRRLIEVMQQVPSQRDRKAIILGMTKLLVEAPELQGPYAEHWGATLTGIFKLLELPIEAAKPEELSFEEDEGGYKATYSRLAFAGSGERDFCAEVQDPKAAVVQQVHAFAQSHAGALASVPADVQAVLQQYFQAMGLPAVA
ncbi:uncharacterized protein MONBRDRAFT_35084 [Monosiga brevicollis MX1]|uniref:Importin N-terminal domain-containing protein n=1 Tax=Monosiga brevicollis TaxID=81824 RepID=A9UWF7_MONBE|nr:uncharacterized protein MONBRDRAFT_35084 [Monosiga brevicollis MX1]EDQ90557.1 predicted protein [Monosiga brevicollis MX1]|eukprot:XP_001744608.1 hypothetical protein [Monosiga brevicollis MX1]